MTLIPASMGAAFRHNDSEMSKAEVHRLRVATQAAVDVAARNQQRVALLEKSNAEIVEEVNRLSKFVADLLAQVGGLEGRVKALEGQGEPF